MCKTRVIHANIFHKIKFGISILRDCNVAYLKQENGIFSREVGFNDSNTRF